MLARARRAGRVPKIFEQTFVPYGSPSLIIDPIEPQPPAIGRMRQGVP